MPLATNQRERRHGNGPGTHEAARGGVAAWGVVWAPSFRLMTGKCGLALSMNGGVYAPRARGFENRIRRDSRTSPPSTAKIRSSGRSHPSLGMMNSDVEETRILTIGADGTVLHSAFAVH